MLLFAAQIGCGIVVITNKENKDNTFCIDHCIFQAIAGRQVKLPDIPMHLFNRPVGFPASLGMRTQYLPDGVLFVVTKCSDLQTVARGLANKHRFQLTFCANTGPRKPIFTANEPTFAANSLQTVS